MVSSAKIFLYADRIDLRPGEEHIPLLHPFWGPNPEPDGDPCIGRFDAWVRHGRELFELTTKENADFFVLPYFWRGGEDNPEAGRLAAEAAGLGKKIIVYFTVNSQERIPLDNAIVLRTSFRKSAAAPNEFAIPAWSEDFLERYRSGQLATRPWQSKPSIGFCGQSFPLDAFNPTLAREWLRGVKRRLIPNSVDPRALDPSPHLLLRRSCLRRLASAPQVQTDFLIRPQFFNGVYRGGKPDPQAVQAARAQFVSNLIGNDYALCVRGLGNFSYRFYEALSCGRIPVFIDTNCVLPFEEWMRWDDYILRIPADEIHSLPEKLLAFHARLNDDSFGRLQRACRTLWEDWLSPLGFHSHLHLYLASESSLSEPSPPP